MSVVFFAMAPLNLFRRFISLEVNYPVAIQERNHGGKPSYIAEPAMKSAVATRLPGSQ
ncbi:hypothetical protein [Mesorhizobium sp. M1A.F.Ca.ET.072.01.1.1]|uniref:hypothetical protein n=1 Tax=Mesorhizobium sp. M1A.F.Ca.ET.072.01.1.1 TaxID=2496753 RepID=UPI0016724098|nr:hypothetical protein [Mesorhizobium sp. M1A.F.Ca.ET.072.01.1.1]